MREGRKRKGVRIEREKIKSKREEWRRDGE